MKPSILSKGIVGLAGGLGGFALPILFGVLVDLTGIRSSAFMLLYGVVWVSLIWMYLTEVRRTDVMTAGASPADVTRNQVSTQASTQASTQVSSQAGTPS